MTRKGLSIILRGVEGDVGSKATYSLRRESEAFGGECKESILPAGFFGIPYSHCIQYNLGNVTLKVLTPLKPPIPRRLLVSRNKKIPAWT